MGLFDQYTGGSSSGGGRSGGGLFDNYITAAPQPQAQPQQEGGILGFLHRATQPVGNFLNRFAPIIKPAESVINTLYNPVKDVQMIAGGIAHSAENVAKEGYNAAKTIVWNSPQELFHSGVAIKDLLQHDYQGAYKENNITKNLQNNDQFVKDFFGTSEANAKDPGGQLVKNLGHAGGFVLDVANTVMPIEAGWKAIFKSPAFFKEAGTTIAQNGIKSIWSGAADAGIPTFKDIASANSFKEGATNLLKKSIDELALTRVAKSPLGEMIGQNISRPLATQAIRAGVTAQASDTLAHATGNKDGLGAATSAEPLKDNKILNFIAPVFGHGGALTDFIGALSSESTLGKAPGVFQSIVGNSLPKASSAGAELELSRQAILNRFNQNLDKYKNADGQLNTDQMVKDLLATVTPQEKRAVLDQWKTQLPEKYAGLPEKQALSQWWKDYQPALEATQGLEKKLNLQPGTLSPLRQDTPTELKLQQIASDIQKWHGGQLPPSVAAILHPEDRNAAVATWKDLKGQLKNSPFITTLVDRHGSPAFPMGENVSKDTIIQRLQKMAQSENKMIPLDDKTKSIVEKAGYQGIGYTPFVRVTKERADTGAAYETIAPQQIATKGVAGVDTTASKAGSQSTNASGVAQSELLGNRNLAGKAHDALDRILGFATPTRNESVTAEFGRKFDSKLATQFPNGVQDRHGNLYDTTGTGIGASVRDVLHEITAKGAVGLLGHAEAGGTQGLSKGALRDVFGKETGGTIYKAIKDSLPTNWREQGLEAVQNTLRQKLPFYNEYVNFLNTTKYTQNPLFTQVQLPVKLNLISFTNGFNPFKPANEDVLKNIGSILGHGGKDEQMILETLGNQKKTSEVAATIAQQMMEGGKVYGLSQKYDSVANLLTNGQDAQRVKDVVQSLVHYGARTPLERSINTILFPFSFEVGKVIPKVFGGLGKQSGLLPILAAHQLVKLSDYMQSPDYKKWSAQHPAEAYLLTKINPLSGLLEKPAAGESPLEIGGQYGGGIMSMLQGYDKATKDSVNKYGDVTPAPKDVPGKINAFLNSVGSTAGIIGITDKLVNKILGEQKYNKDQAAIQAGTQFKDMTGNKLLYDQILKMAGNQGLDKFFSQHPELDPTNPQFQGFDVSNHKDIAAGFQIAGNAQEKLAYMQNVALSGSKYFDKFFAAHPELDPNSPNFQGFKNGGVYNKQQAAKSYIRRQAKYAMSRIQGRAKASSNRSIRSTGVHQASKRGGHASLSSILKRGSHVKSARVPKAKVAHVSSRPVKIGHIRLK